VAVPQAPDSVHGILNLNKPPGMTSFSVVGIVRRLTGVRRVGHAGTLDPAADGVLPICLGQATRLAEHVVNAPKTYRARIHLGVVTDTYDTEGTVTARADPSGVTQEDIRAALPLFTGRIQQLPPMYSALKHQGTPLYRLARAGQTVERAPRTVSIYRLELVECEPPLLAVEIECGRGAYVRSLAHDLGQHLGCGAHLAALTRTKSGPFLLEWALTLEDFRQAAQEGGWREFLHATDSVLAGWWAAVLGREHADDVMQGRTVPLTPLAPERVAGLPPGTPCRAYSTDGRFLAILHYRGEQSWHPAKVFTAS
jgi:tRNA pseudouridine55 synthase